MRRKVEPVIEAALERIRNHPFITGANAGALDPRQAERWIFCAGRESRSFPHLLRQLIARSEIPAIRDLLQKNLDDEMGHGVPADVHFHHYLELLDALSIPRDSFDAYCEGAGLGYALSLAFSTAASAGEARAVGYMLVNEGMTQITYGAMQAALERVRGPISVPFFQLHVAVDEEHVEDLWRAVEHLPPSAATELIYGIELGERGMAALMDEAYGVLDDSARPAFEPVANAAA